MWWRDTPFTLGGSGRAHLAVHGLSAGYGGFMVLRDVSLEARPGLTVILGPNGAGKTTLLNAIAGLLPFGGLVMLDGEVLPEKTHGIVRAGVVLVAEGRRLFPQMSVRENLELGAWLATRAERERRLAGVLDDFPTLRQRQAQLAGTMSGGEQQMVAVARAMMSAPRLLLLDEPSLGLAPKIIADLFAVLDQLADEGMTLLVVDQMAGLALALADRAYVIEGGQIVAQGRADAMADDPALAQAYLGEQRAASPVEPVAS